MRRAAATALAVVLLTGCRPTPGPSSSRPSTSPSPVREFTVATTDRVTTTDPAAAVLPADQAYAYNVFQRLMTVEPEHGKLVPDAASDCKFASATVYECRLRENLRFHDGTPVEAEDVRFSVLRALRLDVPGSSVGALSSLARVETSGRDTVRFVLRWSDREFGHVLTGPALSIVPRRTYDADRLRALDEPVVGSGAYRAGSVTADTRTFLRFTDYQGISGGQLESVVVQRYADSGALEDAMGRREVDVVWRGLSEAAEQRLADQADQHEDRTTDAGFTAVRQGKCVVHALRWDPRSSHRLDAPLRAAIAAALQEDRTLDSLLLPGQPGHVAAFPLGGRPSPAPAPPAARITLTMGYDPDVATEAELARRVRDRLETQLGLSVRLVAEPATADLHVGPTSSWLVLPAGQLLDYLASPLPGSAAKLAQLDQRYRTIADPQERDVALSEIQKQAAADLTVVPVAAGDATVYLARGTERSDPLAGPGWQPLFSVLHR